MGEGLRPALTPPRSLLRPPPPAGRFSLRSLRRPRSAGDSAGQPVSCARGPQPAARRREGGGAWEDVERGGGGAGRGRGRVGGEGAGCEEGGVRGGDGGGV